MLHRNLECTNEKEKSQKRTGSKTKVLLTSLRIGAFVFTASRFCNLGRMFQYRTLDILISLTVLISSLLPIFWCNLFLAISQPNSAREKMELSWKFQRKCIQESNK